MTTVVETFYCDTFDWTSGGSAPDNAEGAPDDAYAYHTGTSNPTALAYFGTLSSLGIPANATITDITFGVRAAESNTAGNCFFSTAYCNSGACGISNVAATSIPGAELTISLTWYTIDHSNALWTGTSVTPANINGPNTLANAVRISMSFSKSTSYDLRIDAVRMIVTYELPDSANALFFGSNF